MRTTFDKVKIFRNLFAGLTSAYGTYNPATGRAYHVKKQVADSVLLGHLAGKKPYGFYPLMNDKTRITVADFDTQNRLHPIEFLNSARHYQLSAYIERSKSKGHHAWIFFEEQGVLASKARLVVRHILDEIEQPDTEVFPKQDTLDTNVRYGNFINAPLFAPLVPKGKTVFIDPYTFEPYSNQWDFLKSVTKHTESILDDIIELNDLSVKTENEFEKDKTQTKGLAFSLPPCARIILQDGISKNQRCSCFTLAVHLKRLGIPKDGAVALLKNWAEKNKPEGNKRIITEEEIVEQVSYAYQKSYSSYGCDREEIKLFCQPECPLNLVKIRSKYDR